MRNMNALFVYTTFVFCAVLLIGCEKETTVLPIFNEKPTSLEALLPTEIITVGSQQITVELAINNQTRQKGLMNRKHLDQDKGMLFIFRKESELEFHMNNCLIDIDIAFLDQSGKITTIYEMKNPPQGQQSKLYHTKSKSKYALELAAGTLKRLNVNEGDIIVIPKKIQRISPEASLR